MTKGQRDASGSRLTWHALERFKERFHVPEPEAEPALRAALSRTRRLGRNPSNGAVALLGLHRGRMLVAIERDGACLTVLTWPQFEPRLPEFGRARLPRKRGRMLRRLAGMASGVIDRPDGDRSIMVIVLMGVSGAGKTTVGEVLADRLGWTFHDADAFHPVANVEKMHRGEPLNDDDRAPWLRALSAMIDASRERAEDVVLACSALKHAYQEYLDHHHGDLRFVCLCGPADLIAERLSRRTGHFMPPGLLESQLEILEPPDDALRVGVDGTPEETAEAIVSGLGL